MSQTINGAIAQIDKLIRGGDHRLAETDLEILLLAQIPREYLWQVSALARRLSRSELGIKLLAPIIRPPPKKPIDSMPEEKAEYAACLIRLGLLSEAHRLLDEVDANKVPMSYLFRAFAHIAVWNFSESNKALHSFISSKRSTPYEILIAKVNLAVGLVYEENYDSAGPLIEELIETNRRSKNYLLLGNILEIGSQAAMENKKWKLAEKMLDEADKILNSPDTFDGFLIRKRRAILKALLHKKTEDLVSVKREAIERKYWESARDCDFHLASVKPQRTLARRLYFGTPFESYRQRILKSLNETLVKPQEEYFLNIGNGKKVFTINSISGEIYANSQYLKRGQILYRLFNCIAEDFYRPKRIAEIFDQVYADEFYSQTSSPDKVHQALKRLREFLESVGVPLVIKERLGAFSLTALKGNRVEIVLSKEKSVNFFKPDLIKVNRRLLQLKKEFEGKEFTTPEATQTLRLSERSINYLLGNLGTDQLIRIGVGPSTKYKFANAK